MNRGGRKNLSVWLRVMAGLCLGLFILTLAGKVVISAAEKANPFQSKEHQKSRQPVRVLVRVGGDHDYPPYSYIEKGVVTGFDIEMIRSVAEVMNWEIEFSLSTWGEARRRLEQGEIDVISGMAITDERKRLYDFSNPFAVISFDVFTRSKSRLTSSADLAGKVVALQAGAVMEQWVDEQEWGATVLSEADAPQALQCVAAEKCDAALINHLQGMYLIDKLNLSNLEAMGETILPREYAFAVREGNQALINDLNEGLAILRSTGRFNKIEQKWLGIYERSLWWQRYEFYIYILGVVAILLVITLVVLSVLRREILQRTQELSQSKEKYRQLVENSSEGILVSGNDHFVFVNPRALEIFANDRETLLSLTYKDFTHPDDYALVMQNHHRRLEGKEADQNYSSRIINGRGEMRWVNTRSVRIEWEGKPATLDLLTDITEQKETQDALLDSEMRFRRIFEDAPIGIYIVDESEQITQANRAFLNMLGYAEDEVIGLAPDDLIAPEDRTPEIGGSVYRQVRNEPFKPSLSIRIYQHKDGHKVWVEKAVSMVQGDNLKPPYFIVEVQDISEQLKVVSELRQSEERYRLLFQKSPVGLFQYDLNLCITDINEEFIKIIQGQRELLNHFDFKTLQDTRVMDALKAPLRGEDGFYEGPYLTIISKLDLIILLRTAPLFNAAGEITGGIAILEDITDRSRAEEALRQSEDKFSKAFHISPDAVLIVRTEDGQVLEVNEGFENITGYTAAEVLGKSLVELDLWFSMKERDAVRETLNSTGEVRNTQIRFQRKEGRAVVGLVSARVIEINSNECSIAIVRDITDQVQAEAEIKRQRDFAEGLINMAQVVVLVLDPDGKVVLANPKFEEITGYEAREIIGKDYFRTIIPPALYHEVSELFQQALRGVFANGSINPILTKEGTAVEVEWYDRLLTDPEGKLIGVMAVGLDVSERMRSEQAILESERRYRTIFSTSPMAVMELDMSSLFLFIQETNATTPETLRNLMAFDPSFADNAVRKLVLNDANDYTLRLYGVETKEALQKEFVDYLEVAVNPIIGNVLMAMVEGQEVYEGETINRNHNGEIRNLLLRINLPSNLEEAKRIIVSMVDITEQKKTEQQLKLQLQRLGALRAVDLAINASIDLEITLRVLVNQITTQLEVDAAAVLMYNPATQMLTFAAGEGFIGDEIKKTRLRIGESLAGRAALDRRTVIVPDIAKSVDRFSFLDSRTEDFHAYVGVPLIAKGGVKGVLEVFLRRPFDVDEQWLEFLKAMADQASIAIENATLFNDVQNANIKLMHAYDATIEGWARALELRDGETEGHSERVTSLTLELCRRMGIPEEEQIHIRRGAFLHDIGKMAIPDSILFKPDTLDEEEWKVMREHPSLALQFLSPVEFLRPAMDIPYCHHESWDGSGYPRGLAGKEIPLNARIFSVVDCWDALKSDRPYRKAWQDEKIVDYLRGEAGKRYDPDVIQVFLQMLDEKEDGHQ